MIPNSNKIKQLETFSSLGKVPPQCVDVEKLLLGTILVYGEDIISIINKIITIDSFYDPINAKIYEAMLVLFEEMSPVEILSVYKKIELIGYGDDIDPTYITEITNSVTTASKADYYAKLIQQSFILREIIRVCNEIMKLAYSNQIDLTKVISKFENEIKELERKAGLVDNSNKNIVSDVIKNIAKIKQFGNTDVLITSNPEINKVIDLTPGEIIYLAGPPKSTKTKTLIYVMNDILQRNRDKLNVKWFCMEDPVEKIIRNMISMNTGIDDFSLQGKGKHLTSADLELINEVSKRIDHSGYVDYIDAPTSIEDIARSFQSSIKRDKINILIIDNFNICVGKIYGNKTMNEKEIHIADSIQHLSSNLKHNGYKCIIIVVDHLNKSVMDKLNIESGYRARTSHLKGSERKYATLTQLVLVNRPGKNPDLLDIERYAPDVEINGRYHKRVDILASEDGGGLIILEKTEARDGPDQGDEVFCKLYATIGNMQFKNLKDI